VELHVLFVQLVEYYVEGVQLQALLLLALKQSVELFELSSVLLLVATDRAALNLNARRLFSLLRGTLLA